MEDPGIGTPGPGAAARPVKLASIAALLAGSVFLSRVIGYFREVALANRVGAGFEADAYSAAFMLPDLLNYLLAGGALTIAFLPLYVRVLNTRGEQAAGRLFATVLGTLGVVGVLATIAIWWTADALVALQYPRFSEETRSVTVALTRIVLPAQAFFLTGGVIRAVLMAEGRFVAHAVAPLIYNACIITGGLASGRVEGFAWGALVGAIAGPWLVPLIDLARTQRVRVRFAPFDRDFRQYLWLALPLMLGQSLLTVDEWYEKWFGGLLATGTVAQLGYARRLMLVPVAVVGQAIATATLPTLTELWARGRHDELDRTLLRTIQASMALALVGGMALWVFATPLVELVYHHGRFTAEAAAGVSAILAVLAFAVPGWVLQQISVRAFYAREETWRPMLLGSAMVLGAIPVYLALGRRFGATGLAAAGALAITGNGLATLAWARLRYGGPSLSALAVSVARGALVAALAGVAAHAVRLQQPGRTGALTDLALGGLVFAVVVALAARMLGDDVMREALRRITGRLLRLVRRRA